MCCCKGNLLHRESDKFLLMPQEGNHAQVIFHKGKQHEESDTDELFIFNQIEKNGFRHEFFVTKYDQHWLYDRELVVKEILDFILRLGSSKSITNFLVVTGPHKIGIDVIIRKAISFSVGRVENLQSKNIIKLDLSDVK